MNAVALVVALYAVWRVAAVMGRRCERARRESFPFRGAGEPVRCGSCGRIAASAAMTTRGVGPWRAWRCREACAGVGVGEHEQAV